ncbi:MULTISPECIES: hypothetical protein [unclassified Hahella]|uniref:hypothetical protein n=1 Tax=unclassified Hahella TaxID=2624107 RepID=UPI001C1EA7E0|nr:MULTISPECIES: hypothetical protein [unclassified Hahella]MBU6950157.1 hypothetical protein [Hahella sp. HN01]MDG9671227.1 hypothetical protein [Hahella sp. CR1]
MAEEFIIANHTKRQWISPFELSASSKFPSILMSDFVQAGITLLVFQTKTAKFNEYLLGCSNFTRKLLGSWAEGGVSIVGDYSEEALSRRISQDYENISLQVMAMIFETRSAGTDEVMEHIESADKEWLVLINQLLGLEGIEAILEKSLKKAFGAQWKEGFYKRLYQ